MAAAGIRVEGTAEVVRAFRGVDKKLAADFGNDLKKAAEPVAESARSKISRYQGASLRTIRTRRRGANVYVEQSARKVTGLRGDYGSLQMTRGLEPALDEKTDEVFESVRDVLDKYAEGEGF